MEKLWDGKNGLSWQVSFAFQFGACKIGQNKFQEDP